MRTIVGESERGEQPTAKRVAPSHPRRTAELDGNRSFRGHIRELDGLRAVAVVLVFLYHFPPVLTIPRFQLVYEVGWVGVDMFFVISGLLITGILLDSSHDDTYYHNFFVRRSLRIFPLYFVVLITTLLCMALANGGASYHRMVHYWGSPLWLFGFLGNVKTALWNSSPARSFVPMWSVHVEEQFYLVFPFLVRRISRRSLWWVLIAAIGLAPLSRLALWGLAPDRPLLQYMLLPCRMDALALGALIALSLRTRTIRVERRVLGFVASLALVIAFVVFVVGGRTFDSRLERTLGYSLFSAAAAGWILWIVLFRGTRMTNLLNTWPVQYLGRISYGLYLVQMPVAAGLIAFGVQAKSFDTLLGSLALFTACVALASASWYLMEQPILRLKSRWAPSLAERNLGSGLKSGWLRRELASDQRQSTESSGQVD